MEKLPMFNLLKPESLYINSIRSSILEPSKDKDNGNIDEFTNPLYKLENYYNGFMSRKDFEKRLLSTETTSADIAMNVINNFQQRQFNYLLYAQNNPDYKTINPPLAFILEQSKIAVNKFIGITHLDNVSGIESLKIINLSSEHNSLLLIVERPLSRVMTPYKMELGSAAAGMEVNDKKGLKVNIIMSITTNTDGYYNAYSFLEELMEGYKILSNNCNNPHVVILQNGLKSYINNFRQDITLNNIYSRKLYNDIDFQAADVWITLEELLRSKHRSTPIDIFLITTNFHHKVCFCSIHV